MTTGEDGGKDLLDDLVLSDDHFLQLALHDEPVLTEFFEDVAQVARQCVVLVRRSEVRDERSGLMDAETSVVLASGHMTSHL